MYNNFYLKIVDVPANTIYKCKLSGTVTADLGTGTQTFLAYSRATGELIGASAWDPATHNYVVYLQEHPDEGVMLTRRDESGLFFSETYDRLSLCNETFVYGDVFADTAHIRTNITRFVSDIKKIPLFSHTIYNENLKRVVGSINFTSDFLNGIHKFSGVAYSIPRKMRGSVYAENDIIICSENNLRTGEKTPAINTDPFSDGSLMAAYPMQIDGRDCTGNYSSLFFEETRFRKGGYNLFYPAVSPFIVPIVITRAATRTIVFSYEFRSQDYIHFEIFNIPGLLRVTCYYDMIYLFSINGSTETSVNIASITNQSLRPDVPLYGMHQCVVVISSSGLDKVFVDGFLRITKAVGVPTVTNIQQLVVNGNKLASLSEIVLKDFLVFNRELTPFEIFSLWHSSNKSISNIVLNSPIVAIDNLSSSSFKIYGDNLSNNLRASFPLATHVGNVLSNTTGFTSVGGVSIYQDRIQFNGTSGFLFKSPIVGWWDADDLNSMTIATGVSKWIDKSGCGNYQIQNTGAYQPSRQTNIINGRAVLRFDGGDDTLRRMLVQPEEYVSIFHVQKTTDTNYIVFHSSSSGWALWCTSGGAAVSSVSSGSTELRINGTKFDTNSTNGQLYTALNNIVAVVSLIGLNISKWVATYFEMCGMASYYAAIDLGEIILVPGIVTNDQAQAVEGFLAHRWGTTGSLPVGHPYKSSAPVGTLEEIVTGSTYNPTTSDISIKFSPKTTLVAQCLWKKGSELTGLAIGISSTGFLTLYNRVNTVLTSSAFTQKVFPGITYTFELKGSDMTLYNACGAIIETKAHGLTISSYVGSESLGAAYGGSPITGTSAFEYFSGFVYDLTITASNTMSKDAVDSENKIAVLSGVNECPVEVVKWDISGDSAILYGNIPEVFSGQDTIIDIKSHVLPSKSGLTGTEKAQKVWDVDYLCVYHMVPGTKLIDSTANKFDGILYNIDSGNFISDDTGYLLDLNGTDEYAVVEYPVIKGNPRIGISALFSADTISNGTPLLDLALSSGDDTGRQISLEFNGSSNLVSSAYNASNTLIGSVISGAVSTSTNVDIAINYDGTSSASGMELFVNGVSYDTDSPTGDKISTSAGKLFIGKDAYNSTYLNGKISELAISSKQRSADFEKLRYLSLQDNLGTYSTPVSTLKVLLKRPVDTLRDYPVLIRLSTCSGILGFDATPIFTTLGVNWNRLIIKDSLGTSLPIEMELWDDAGNSAILHVKVPIISSLTDTILTIDYSSVSVNPLIDTVGTTVGKSVWSNGYLSVYHMNQDPSVGGACILDSAGTYNATPSGTMTSGDLVDSTIGKGLDFDGTDDYLTASQPSLPLDCTFEVATVDLPSLTLDVGIFHKGDNIQTANTGICLTVQPTGTLYALYFNGAYRALTASAGFPKAPLLGPTNLSLTINSSALSYTFGMNGYYETGVMPNAIVSTASTFKIGANKDSAIRYPYSGTMSEFRFSYVARSGAWLSYTDLNFKDEVNSFYMDVTAQFTIASGLITANQKNVPVMLKLSDSSGIGNTDITPIFDALRTKYKKVTGTSPKYYEFGSRRKGTSDFTYPVLAQESGQRLEKGGAIRFFGVTNSFINITNDISRTLLWGSVSVSLEVRSDMAAIAEVLLFGTPNEFGIYMSSTGVVLYKHTVTAYSSTEPILANKNTHIVVTRNLITKLICIYQGGLLTYSGIYNYLYPPTIAAVDITIGSNSWAGVISNVQVFDRELTAREANNLYKSAEYSIHKDSITTSIIKQDVPILLGENLSSITVADSLSSITTPEYTYELWRHLPDSTQSGDFTWNAAPNLTFGFPYKQSSSFTVKNYVYLLLGTDIRRAQIDSSGVLGSPFDVYSTFNSNDYRPKFIVTSTYVYAVGQTSISVNIWRATVNHTTGDVGTFAVDSTIQLAVACYSSSIVVYKNTVFVIGGGDGTSPATRRVKAIQTATINNSGVLSPFVYSQDLPYGLENVHATLVGNKIYLFGAQLTDTTSTGNLITVGEIDENFQISWSIAPYYFPTTSFGTYTVAVKDYIYCICNATTSTYAGYVGTVYRFPLDGNGNLSGPAVQLTSIPLNFLPGMVLVTSSRIYVVGGVNNISQYSLAVYYATFTGGKNDHTADLYENVTVQVDYNKADILYSVSKDDLTYNIFNSTWKPIVSIDPAVHGFTGDSSPYYWDADTEEWVYANSSIEEAISTAVSHPDNRMRKDVLNGLSNFTSVYSSSIGKIHIATSLFSAGQVNPEITKISINNKGYWVSKEYSLEDYCSVVSSSKVVFSCTPPDSAFDYMAATKIYSLVTGGTQWQECVAGEIPNVPVGLNTTGKKVQFRVVWDLEVWSVWSTISDASVEVTIN